MKRTLLVLVAILAAATIPALAGEWHTGNNNLCTDCHTMHFSQQHNWDGTTPVPTTAGANGNWLSASGPNAFLLKAPVNQLCLACHDNQTFAPDVFGANINAASQAQGRSAGALNGTASGAGYESYKGHTLDSTATPPGFDPTVVGLVATWYDPTGGLECVSCHTQHGIVGSYRNLGPRSLVTSGGALTAAATTYVINSTNDTTKDVWISLASYAANSGTVATMAPFYDSSNVSYNRVDKTVGTTKTSNGIDTMCASCHGNFHGGPGDTGIGASAAALDGFIRHPTSQVVIGASGAQGYGGHSALSRYTGATTKVKVYASDRTGYTDATPGCVSCHKAHGNQNPFGLVFLNRNAASVTEEGGFSTAQTTAVPPETTLKDGYRNVCGQCHSQGNS